MSPIDWATRPLKKYANFSGRAPRAEYWWFAVLSGVANLLAIFIDRLLGTGEMLGSDGLPGTNGIFLLVVGLGLFLPALAVMVRRLHDTDRSAWWLLIGLIPLVGVIVLIVFFVLKGTDDSNRFGPNPYAADPSGL